MVKRSIIGKVAKSSFIACFLMPLVAQAMPHSWQTECVGRLLVDLPGDATMAGVSYEDFLEDVRTPSHSVPYKFSDKQAAPWVRILYKGDLAISNPLDSRMKDTIVQAFLSAKNAAKARIAENSMHGDGSLSFADVYDMPQGSAAWTDGRTVKTLVSLGDRMIMVRVSSGRGLPASLSMARDLAEKTTSRQLFEVPEQPGVCVPGAFLTMGNPDVRNIGSMYRINEHPDLTIFLRDANAATYSTSIRERNAAPLQKVRSFWAEYGVMAAVKRLTPLSGVFESRTVTIAGRDGKSSTVEIQRGDGTIDYGFYTSVRGVPGDMTAPDLELLVLTDGKRAKDKGVVPVDKGEFQQISLQIADTVRLRK